MYHLTQDLSSFGYKITTAAGVCVCVCVCQDIKHMNECVAFWLLQ